MGHRAQGSGCGPHSGFSVWGTGPRAQGAGHTQGSGYGHRAQGSGCRPHSGFRVWGTGLRAQGVGSRAGLLLLQTVSRFM